MNSLFLSRARARGICSPCFSSVKFTSPSSTPFPIFNQEVIYPRSIQFCEASLPHLHGGPYSPLASLLQACIPGKSIRPGKQIHGFLIVNGLGEDTVLGTKLVNLYAVGNCVADARQVFERISKRNVFLWNVLIRGYAWDGPLEEAIKLFYGMVDVGLRPDNFTFPFVLKACSGLSALKVGKDVHELAVQTGWESDVFVGAGLVDMYAKCGCVDRAHEVFDKMPVRDVVLWNSMVGAYAQNGRPNEALSLCREMRLKGFRLTDATIVTALSASADSAALPQGREIHGYSWRNGFAAHERVGTALVDMYAKGGLVENARRLFDRLAEKRTISWNAMIAGYGMHGHAAEALALFEEMKRTGSVPDHITFVGVLSACSHGGLMDEGWELFNSMKRDYSIEPRVEHYTCVVALLGHSKRLDEAHDLILSMPVEPDTGIWGSLLSSCKIHKNVRLGEMALQKLIELEPTDAGNYVMLSNIYAQSGNWEGVVQMRTMMQERGLKKAVACSWIKVKNQVHAFLAGDTTHPDSEKIYSELETLKGLMEEAGYVPDTAPVFHDVEDDEKMNILHSHSERLALAFGLISTSPGTRLLITKNIRICDDCHVFIKYASKVVRREIVVRDVNRYHHFRDGECSCGGYW
ncbi:unnamed protein product [Victoria cruziana]